MRKSSPHRGVPAEEMMELDKRLMLCTARKLIAIYFECLFFLVIIVPNFIPSVTQFSL